MADVIVYVQTRLVIEVNDETDIDQVLSNMDYNFTAADGGNARIKATEITEWEVNP